MLKIINLAIFIIFILNLSSFGEELNDLKYIKEYINNIERVNNRKLHYITNMTFKCYYYYISKIQDLEKDILDAAKNNRYEKIPLIPSDGYSYCPKVLINISSQPLEPEGIFRKGIIIINYNPAESCKKREIFKVFTEKICQKPSFNLTLMHELTHFAFSKVYGNIRFRKILFNEYKKCKEKNCPNILLLKKIVAYRNFYDEFPAILFSNIWTKLQNCKYRDEREIPNFKYFIKTSIFLSKREFLDCRINDKCGVFYLYRQLKNVANGFNICISNKTAFEILLETSIKDEKKNFLPLIKEYFERYKE